MIRGRPLFTTHTSHGTDTPCPGGSLSILEAPRSRLKVKVCLVGESAVGKSSLIRRYVLDMFDDSYLQTLGAKVSKKSLMLPVPRSAPAREVVMTIWDIMGNSGFQELLKESYFYGCQGLLAVADVTRRATLEGLDGWIERAWGVAGEVPVHFLLNKVDLVRDTDEDVDRVRAFSAAYDAPDAFTSARRGDNVVRAFEDLARRILDPRPANPVLLEAV